MAAETIELCLRAAVGATRHASVLEAFRLIEKRRRKRARRVQNESRVLALVTVNLAGWAVLRVVRDSALRWIGRRTERWRLPIFDFLNNYRVGGERTV